MSDSQTPVDDPDSVTLDEWCAEQSLTDGRVELLAVFRFREMRAGHRRDLRAAFASRYALTEQTPTI